MRILHADKVLVKMLLIKLNTYSLTRMFLCLSGEARVRLWAAGVHSRHDLYGRHPTSGGRDRTVAVRGHHVRHAVHNAVSPRGALPHQRQGYIMCCKIKINIIASKMSKCILNTMF